MTYTFLIHAVITQIFIAAVELAVLSGIPIKEAKVEMEKNPVTKLKNVKTWYNLKFYKRFCASYFLVYFSLYFQ